MSGEESSQLAFKQFNPNPERNLTEDCVIRAICAATGRDWEDIYISVSIQGLLMHKMPEANSVWGEYLSKLGFEKSLVPNICPHCYTLKEFCADNPKGIYVVNTDGHAVGVVNGDYYDTWDSGDEIVNYYWKRSEIT